MFRLGFRAHDFGRFTSIGDLASAIGKHRDKSIVQLALRRAVPTFKDTSEMTSDDAVAIRTTLDAHGVSIGIIGSSFNPVHPVLEERQKGIASFTKLIRLSSILGCRIVATETGSANPDCSYNEETRTEKYFSILCRTVEILLKEAELHDAIVALEPVARQHTIDSTEKMRHLIDVFGSNRLKVILDPVNLVPWTGMGKNEDSSLDATATESFIDSISAPVKGFVEAIHEKNYILVDGWKKGDMPLLKGVFDWSAAIPALKKNGIDDIPFLLENLDIAALDDTEAYLTPLL